MGESEAEEVAASGWWAVRASIPPPTPQEQRQAIQRRSAIRDVMGFINVILSF